MDGGAWRATMGSRTLAWEPPWTEGPGRLVYGVAESDLTKQQEGIKTSSESWLVFLTYKERFASETSGRTTG